MLFIQRLITFSLPAAWLLAATAVNPVLADAGHSHGQGRDVVEIGKPGKASAADRTVEITLGEMYYEPASINVNAGETVMFVIRNSGELLHEFSLGTASMHAEHRKEMAEMVESGALTPTSMDHSKMGHGHMMHDDPNSVLVEPGRTAERIWTFPKAAELQFSCNVPGHSEAGMVGDISIDQ
jgi:uncharacterized cupredoxin-like copper-binding protein